MNWKEYGRKWSWPNLKYYPGICLDGLSKTTETSVTFAGLRAEIWIPDLQNKQERWPLGPNIRVSYFHSQPASVHMDGVGYVISIRTEYWLFIQLRYLDWKGENN
jgi:hypothetical protein